MSMKMTVAVSLLFVGGAASAQSSLPTVEVSAESEETLTIACREPAPPSLKEVERVLEIGDPALTVPLRKELMGAAAEACAAGEPRIQVVRGASSRELSWKALSAP